ncbi:hypothetical protein ACFE04_008761 [Oxalis oulophora]
MVSSSEANEKLVYDIRLSSIGPSQVTGDVIHEPSNMDLAMKLHYLKCVYIYSSEAGKNISLERIKEVMFLWLNEHYPSCGRLRRSESGRPYVKCNDCGIRFVEANCGKTVEEWLEITANDDSVQNLLVYHAPIGPDLAFSPLIYIQATNFKCGGLALSLNWAHLLGDAFSIAEWFNSWGPRMSGNKLKSEPSFTKPEKPKSPTPITKDPVTAKLVDPVGDIWVTPKNKCKMETFSFHITQTQLTNLQSKVSLGKKKAPEFESLCAIIWQCVAIVRDGAELKTVTILKKDPTRKKGQLGNYLVISSVQTNISVSDADLGNLAKLLVDEGVDDGSKIEAAIERDDSSDFIIYGANLTFVDLEGADLYGMEIYGHKPELVYYAIENVDDEGVVMVHPFGKEGGGRLVTLTLPDNEVIKVKNEMRKNGVFPEHDLE